jgi:ribosomal protein S18 acetylase RimI-like enzyme
MKLVNFQRATVEDCEQLEKLDISLFGEDAFSETTFKRELAEGTCILAKYEDDILGYAFVRDSPVIHDLIRLGVREDCQHQGLGRALLKRAITDFPGKMVLLVKRWNSNALQLYKSEGFSICGMLNDSWEMIRS